MLNANVAPTCNTCCKPASSPFRRYDDRGKVIHGCVDAFHSDSLRGIVSESARWHFRPEAKAIRLADAKRMRAIRAEVR